MLETIVCRFDGHTFEREATRGRKPHYCDRHRLGAPNGKSAATTTTLPAPKVSAVPVSSLPDVPDGVHANFWQLMTVTLPDPLTTNRGNAYLFGPAASGKTTAGAQLAEHFGLPFYGKSCHETMTEADLFGYMDANGNYVEGILYRAFKNGGVQLLDEVDASNAATLTAVNAIAALGTGQVWTFPNGENVPRHPDFVLICGGNTNGRGADDFYITRVQLDEAFLTRFSSIVWNYDETVEKGMAGEQQEWFLHVLKARRAAERNGLRVVICPRHTAKGASLLRKGMPWSVVEELELWNPLDPDTAESLRSAMAKL